MRRLLSFIRDTVLRLALVLRAEIERDHRGENRGKLFAADDASQGQRRKRRRQNQRHNTLDAQEPLQPFSHSASPPVSSYALTPESAKSSRLENRLLFLCLC